MFSAILEIKRRVSVGLDGVGGQSTPMSYSEAGKQYIVTAAGGHGLFHTKLGDYIVAYTLGE